VCVSVVDSDEAHVRDKFCDYRMLRRRTDYREGQQQQRGMMMTLSRGLRVNRVRMYHLCQSIVRAHLVRSP